MIVGKTPSQVRQRRGLTHPPRMNHELAARVVWSDGVTVVTDDGATGRQRVSTV
jgi:hypothetical protein